ncbi:MAG: molybdopterin cofactor-binding domain-containing protein [Maricaulaceae bacterium]
MAKADKKPRGKVAKIARRTFLVGSVAVVGGVTFGVWRYKTPYGNPLEKDLPDGEATLTPYVKINQDGVTIITPRAEMGQGVQTTLAAMVAEELDMDWADVRIEHGPPSKAYYNAALLEEMAGYSSTDNSEKAARARGLTKIPAKFLALQVTGGSTSMVDAYEKMRLAGASARAALLKAAAKRFDVDVDTLTTMAGHVVAPSGERFAYTQLAEDAAKVKLPKRPKLRAKSDWKLLGKSLPRLDMVGKATGTETYSLDVRLPNMLYAALKMGPMVGAQLETYDASAAKDMPGVEAILPISDGVAVLARNSWAAMQAAQEISAEFKAPDYRQSSDEQFAAFATQFNDDHLDDESRNDGDIEGALQSGNIIEREYSVPYLAHATMEPMNATAQLKDGRLDIWVGTQSPLALQQIARTVTGLEMENIHVHTLAMGGGFGRRSETDYAIQAVEIAQQLQGRPVKLTWSREDDMRHDVYRPMATARFKGKIENGKAAALDGQLMCASTLESAMGRSGMPAPGSDFSTVQAAWDQPFDIPNYRIRGYRSQQQLPLGYWRSVGASQNAFFHDSMMDEMAHAAGVDPLEFRLQSINHMPSRKVLERVGEMSSWGSILPAGRARGIGFCLSFGVPSAQVIEISQTDDGIKLEKAFAVVDVGTVLDPRNVEAQVFGGMTFGLTAAIMGEITVEGGEVVQGNFDSYDALRMYQAPTFEVEILENEPHIRGIGEPGTPPAAPAIVNAIFALTGRRLRSLPLNKHVDFV